MVLRRFFPDHGEPDLIERWNGLRVVAGDASVLVLAVRPCLLARSAAAPPQRLFALFLPGAESTLHASVNSALVGERGVPRGGSGSARARRCAGARSRLSGELSLRQNGYGV